MKRNITKEQLENIQIDYGMVFLNYGEIDQKRLGPTRGGGQFTASKNIRNIEYDGRLGRTKGAQVIDEMDAMLQVGVMNMGLDVLEFALPGAKLEGGKLVNTVGGIIPDDKYFKNVTMFCKTVGGDYKKITLFNAMNEADFTLNAQPKEEGVVTMEIYAHWDIEDVDTGKLYIVEDVTEIADLA